MSPKERERNPVIADKRYSIEEVKALTGYSTGHLRHLERDGKIPKAYRDDKEWRFWMGEQVNEILDYKYAIYHKEKVKEK